MTPRASRTLGTFWCALVLACTPGAETGDGRPVGGAAPPATRPGPTAFADAVGVSPERYRVLETAPGVRLLAGVWPAGGRDRPHSHPISIWYALTDMRLRIETRPSRPLVRTISASDTGIQPPVLRHSIYNVGHHRAEILILEIEPRSSPPVDPPASSAPRSIAMGNHFRLLEQHDDFRLVEGTFDPQQRDHLHSHPASFWFALTRAHLRMEEPGSRPFELHFEAGESRLMDAIDAHTATNLGSGIARLLFFEMPRRTEPGPL